MVKTMLFTKDFEAMRNAMLSEYQETSKRIEESRIALDKEIERFDREYEEISKRIDESFKALKAEFEAEADEYTFNSNSRRANDLFNQQMLLEQQNRFTQQQVMDSWNHQHHVNNHINMVNNFM
jgi:hypothetical protein